MKRLFVLLLVFSLVLTACGKGKDEPNETGTETSPVEEEKNKEDDLIEEAGESNKETGQTEEPVNSEETWIGSGIYKGEKETGVIEIETNNGIQTFQLTEEAEEDVKYLEQGEEVKFTYYADDGEEKIGFIEKRAYYDQPRGHHKHHEHRRHFRHHENRDWHGHHVRPRHQVPSSDLKEE